MCYVDLLVKSFLKPLAILAAFLVALLLLVNSPSYFFIGLCASWIAFVVLSAIASVLMPLTPTPSTGSDQVTHYPS